MVRFILIGRDAFKMFDPRTPPVQGELVQPPARLQQHQGHFTIIMMMHVGVGDSDLAGDVAQVAARGPEVPRVKLHPSIAAEWSQHLAAATHQKCVTVLILLR